jgi:thiamine-phosphate pyrophosphorylase
MVLAGMDQTLSRLYAIADTATLEARGLALQPLVADWLGAGIRLIQLRHKGHYSRALYESARQVGALCRDAGATLVIDDRADIAALLGAGLHVGQDDLSPADARRVTGPRAMLGYSTHDERQLSAGDREPVDYLAIGPVFATASKENAAPVLGLSRIGGLRALTAKPVVAIGGITRATAPDLWRAGIDSVAVIGDLLPGPGETVRGRADEWVRLVRDVL